MPLFNNFFKKKDGPGKVKILGQYYEDNPEAMAFSAKGLNRYGAQDYSGAVIEFTKAINAQPGNQNFYLMRGTASEDAGDDMQAEKDFKKMLELAPTSFIGAYRLGMVYFRKKDFESAIRWLKVSYNNASDLDLSHAGIGNNNIFFIHKKIIAGNLGNFLIHIKKFEEGIKYLDESIRLDPQYHNPYLVKGMAYVQMGKTQEGIPHLKKAMDLGNPHAASVLKMLEQSPHDSADSGSNDLELDFVFLSSDHLRYENSRHVSGPHQGAPRAIKVEANISEGIGYTVTIYTIDGEHVVIQMAPKQMKLVAADSTKIKLRGYGHDASGASFADYGLTIYHEDGSIQKCVLHMFDRNVDIEYFP